MKAPSCGCRTDAKPKLKSFSLKLATQSIFEAYSCARSACGFWPSRTQTQDQPTFGRFPINRESSEDPSLLRLFPLLNYSTAFGSQFP